MSVEEDPAREAITESLLEDIRNMLKEQGATLAAIAGQAENQGAEWRQGMSIVWEGLIFIILVVGVIFAILMSQEAETPAQDAILESGIEDIRNMLKEQGATLAAIAAKLKIQQGAE